MSESFYHKFRKWRVYLNQSCKHCHCANYSLLKMDSTFCKVHQDVTGALKKHGEQAQLIKVLLNGGQVHVPLIY